MKKNADKPISPTKAHNTLILNVICLVLLLTMNTHSWEPVQMALPTVSVVVKDLLRLSAHTSIRTLLLCKLHHLIKTFVWTSLYTSRPTIDTTHRFNSRCSSYNGHFVTLLSTLSVSLHPVWSYKCELFVKTYVIRELVTRQLENQQLATQPPEENNNEKETWCLCAEPEYGRMIKCDKSECPYQWFHYKCVNIRRKPKGSGIV
ncbi:ING3 [Mytilus coruscus]|uniref:ING3 n=1 Tax=Mytilus coruscus TaxID=42192 RepID=A0A6J8DDJ0_MYTCO|nr:ING3 [Mytilus coruscus]